MSYGISKKVNLRYNEAIIKVTEELKKEGFGILITIDVKETLKKKLDVDFQKYIILGACNPPFAYEVLKEEIEIGLLLPCNVIIYENKLGETIVSAFDPMLMATILNNEKVNSIAGQVREKLQRVIESM
jgi:uncharacterized protein (DUF302 family)